RYLTSHVVDTAFEREWSALHNGALLTVADQAGYDLLMTTEQTCNTTTVLPTGNSPLLCCFQPHGRVCHCGSIRYKRLLRVSLQGCIKKFPFDEAIQSLVHITSCMSVWQHNRGRSQCALWCLTSSHR